MAEDESTDGGELVGHKAILQFFAKSAGQGRLCSTYVFAGPPGIGKRLAAKKIASLLLCADRQGIQCCGLCKPCLEKAEKLFFQEVDFINIIKKSGTSIVDQVREFIQSCESLAHAQSPYFFCLPNIQDCSVQAQNALLKLLEEPPADITFFLTSDHPERMLETILSRSQVIHFNPLSDEEIKSVLMTHDVDYLHMGKIIAYCNGRVDMALLLTHPASIRIFEWLEELFNRTDPDFLVLANEAHTLADDLPCDASDKDRHPRLKLKLFVELFEKIYFEKCLAHCRFHFVAMQILNTAVEELLDSRRSLEGYGHLDLSLEHYFFVAMSRYSQILRYSKIRESEPILSA